MADVIKLTRNDNDDPKTLSQQVFTVTCKCDSILGTFSPSGCEGGLKVKCDFCDEMVEVQCEMLSVNYIEEEQEEEYDVDPLTTADLDHLEETMKFSNDNMFGKCLENHIDDNDKELIFASLKQVLTEENYDKVVSVFHLTCESEWPDASAEEYEYVDDDDDNDIPAWGGEVSHDDSKDDDIEFIDDNEDVEVEVEEEQEAPEPQELPAG